MTQTTHPTTTTRPLVPDQLERAGLGSRFAAMERVFTQFEHHAALAQLALEELQGHLAASREVMAETPSETPPENVIAFPSR